MLVHAPYSILMPPRDGVVVVLSLLLRAKAKSLRKSAVIKTLNMTHYFFFLPSLSLSPFASGVSSTAIPQPNVVNDDADSDEEIMRTKTHAHKPPVLP
jgi:hypothetical protein